MSAAKEGWKKENVHQTVGLAVRSQDVGRWFGGSSARLSALYQIKYVSEWFCVNSGGSRPLKQHICSFRLAQLSAEPQACWYQTCDWPVMPVSGERGAGPAEVDMAAWPVKPRWTFFFYSSSELVSGRCSNVYLKKWNGHLHHSSSPPKYWCNYPKAWNRSQSKNDTPYF